MNVPASEQATLIQHHVASQLDRYLDELSQLCAIESKSGHAAGANAIVAWIRHWVGDRNWDIREWPDADAGAGIAVTARGGRPNGIRLMLCIHHDTVYPVGTLAERPVRRDGDKLIGPGTIDPKAGLLSSLYAMAALDDLDLLGPFATISLVSTPDEETDMRVSTIMLNDLAAEYDVALSVEAGTADGAIVSARKGAALYTLNVTGRAAHASKPEQGAHAILALAQQVVAIQALNAFRPGVTVNVGVIQGGTADNVVPDHARAVIDVRLIGNDGDVEAIDEVMAQIGAHPYVHGTSSTISRDLWFPPMPATQKIVDLAEVAVACAAELGIDLQYTAAGGVTLANLLAGLGLPTLDGLAPMGGGEHGINEFVFVPSILPRLALLALFSATIAERFPER